MVECFKKTLASMLSSFVQENHRDWDKYIPFVMMAHGSSAHETTNYTPNMLMLGRETSTPLDILYEIPSVIQSIPENKWVWELIIKERLVHSHNIVRQTTGMSMNRQKRYRDTKVSYESFKPEDQGLRLFPCYKGRLFFKTYCILERSI